MSPAHRTAPRNPPQSAGEAALRADRRSLGELSRLLGVSRMTISRWARGVDVPEPDNAQLVQTRLGIPAKLWGLRAEPEPEPAPAVALPSPGPAEPEPVEPVPAEPPDPPWPPHDEGPTRKAGEGFRAAVERREAWRKQWQADWLAAWHRAHPIDLAAGGARFRAEGSTR